MKRIIDGKRYDTETAKKVGEWSNGYPINDFNTCSETLYITSKGAFFLHGAGGANSIYAESRGNCRCEGDEITPISESEARDWCEKHKQTSALEKYWSDEIEEA